MAELAPVRSRLLRQLGRAEDLVDAGRGRCTAGHRAPAVRMLRKTSRRLRAVVGRLRAEERAGATEAVVEPLAGSATALIGDAGVLARDVACP